MSGTSELTAVRPSAGRRPLPPITDAELAQVKRLRDVERLPWAAIASKIGRREQTLRDHYERASDVRLAASRKMLASAGLDFIAEDRLMAGGDVLASMLKPEHRAKADTLALGVWRAMSGVKP